MICSSRASCRASKSKFPKKAWRCCGNIIRYGGSRGPSASMCARRFVKGKPLYTNVAVHLKGSFSFQPIDGKPSLTLNFDRFAPGQRFHGLTKIHLNSSLQDPSYLCEALARELFNDAGVPTPRAGHALVNLNGRQLGLFVLIEGVNKQFLKRHFKSANGISTTRRWAAISLTDSK
jgi:spore coat protein CotH